MQKWLMFLAGFIVGILFTLILLTLRQLGDLVFWRGAIYGLGIGVGIMVGTTLINWVVGYLDREKG